MKKGFFITGTDTDVGKTVITAALIRFLNHSGVPAVGVKPVCCGGTEDVEEIQAANPIDLPAETINPLYLSEPAAPKSIGSPIPKLAETIRSISLIKDHLIIAEGAGGWKVPVSDEWDMESLALSLGFPVIIVIANRLGCINHALLTAQAVRQSGLPLAGFILNTIEQTEYAHAQETNRALLEELLPCPCLGEVPIGGVKAPAETFKKVLELLKK